MRAIQRERSGGRRRGLAAALGLSLSAALAGCWAQYASSDPAFPGDFAERHPIALISAPTTVEVFASSGGALDQRTLANLKAFAERYRAFGSGAIAIFTPSTAPTDWRAVGAIRRALARMDEAARVEVFSYAPIPRDGAPPIRVGFVGLKAKVATACGNWPDDLASGSSLEGWRNEPYANFGCAYQSALAAQVDDPRDFVEPRASAAADIEMRMRAIEAVRAGQDPGTNWKTDIVPIGGSSGSD